jgi:hypothetical protein
MLLKPGGWVEHVEFHVIPTSYNGSLPAPTANWARLYTVLHSVGLKVGIELPVAHKFKPMMEAAGLEDV